jgi:hypothetical protein
MLAGADFIGFYLLSGETHEPWFKANNDQVYSYKDFYAAANATTTGNVALNSALYVKDNKVLVGTQKYDGSSLLQVGEVLNDHDSDLGQDNFNVNIYGSYDPTDYDFLGQTKVYWNGTYGAFRVGAVDGNQWDNSKLGRVSFGFGIDTEAHDYSTAIGTQAYATATYSMALGTYVKATGYGSFAIADEINSSDRGDYFLLISKILLVHILVAAIG